MDGPDPATVTHARLYSGTPTTTHSPVLRRAHGGKEDQGHGAGQLPGVLLLAEQRGIERRSPRLFSPLGLGEEAAPHLQRGGEEPLLVWVAWCGGDDM